MSTRHLKRVQEQLQQQPREEEEEEEEEEEARVGSSAPFNPFNLLSDEVSMC